jgi:peroxiredoxin
MQQTESAPAVPGLQPGKKALLAFFETDCPTCQLALPYLNALKNDSVQLLGLSQDDEAATREFIRQLKIEYPVELDRGLQITRAFNPQSVPTIYLLDENRQVQRMLVGFDKQGLNELAATLGHPPIAPADDGAPAWKPGCSSRHLEPEMQDGTQENSAKFLRRTAEPATRITLRDEEDPFEYCRQKFGDALPVVPPTVEKVAAMVKATGLEPETVIARVPPFYGEATVEKIAANAVMAGCVPEMMRTHFAAPLVMINGPARKELGFWSRQNVFSNVAHANSSLGRAFQLILLNIGGGRPDGIDMSALGNPGKFSFCVAENEEENPWEPFHVTRGFRREQSAVSLFAAEPPRGVSEHTAHQGKMVLETISFALATVWSYRSCLTPEAIVVLCPEHVKTIHRDGFTKEQARQYLFENTGIPVRYYADALRAEGTQLAANYKEITVRGEKCYQKFRSPEAISIFVTGGTAGKFSAVIGSWSTGPAGSQMVTYPIPDK